MSQGLVCESALSRLAPRCPGKGEVYAPDWRQTVCRRREASTNVTTNRAANAAAKGSGGGGGVMRLSVGPTIPMATTSLSGASRIAVQIAMPRHLSGILEERQAQKAKHDPAVLRPLDGKQQPAREEHPRDLDPADEEAPEQRRSGRAGRRSLRPRRGSSRRRAPRYRRSACEGRSPRSRRALAPASLLFHHRRWIDTRGLPGPSASRRTAWNEMRRVNAYATRITGAGSNSGE